MEEWDDHCLEHLTSISSKRCASITYCNTLFRPAFCPFYIGDERLRPSSQWQSWTKESKLWNHLTTHISACRWPLTYPHPLCSLEFTDETLFLYYLKDVHDLEISAKMKKSRSNRRDSPNSMRWVTYTTCQKRQKADHVEDELPPAKRPTVTQSQLRNTPTCAPLDTLLKKAAHESTTPGPINNGVTLTPGIEDFEPIEDLSDSLASSTAEQARLLSLSPDPPSARLENQAPPLDEDSLFSEYLRSPSPVISCIQETICKFKDSLLPQYSGPSYSGAISGEEHMLSDSLSYDRT